MQPLYPVLPNIHVRSQYFVDKERPPSSFHPLKFCPLPICWIKSRRLPVNNGNNFTARWRYKDVAEVKIAMSEHDWQVVRQPTSSECSKPGPWQRIDSHEKIMEFLGRRKRTSMTWEIH